MNIPMILTLIVMAAVCAVACRLYYGRGVAHGYEFGRYNDKLDIDKPHGWQDRTASARAILEGDPFMWPELQAPPPIIASANFDGGGKKGWAIKDGGLIPSAFGNSLRDGPDGAYMAAAAALDRQASAASLDPAPPPPAGGYPVPGGGYCFKSEPNSVLHTPPHKVRPKLQPEHFDALGRVTSEGFYHLAGCSYDEANGSGMAQPSIEPQPEREIIGLQVHDTMPRVGVQHVPLTNDERLAGLELGATMRHSDAQVPTEATRGVSPCMSKWAVTSNPMILRRMGKTGEESGELLAVTSRVVIQGLDEIDPGTGKTNRQRLQDESADVLAQIECNIQALGLDRAAIEQRKAKKIGQMSEWESLYGPAYGFAMAQPSERLSAADASSHGPDITMGLAEYLESTKPAMVKVGDGYLGTFGELKLCQVSPAGDGSFALYANPEHVRPRAMETRPADSNNARARESHSLSDGSANVNSVGVVGGACISGNARWDQLHAASGYGMAQPSELSVEKALACEHLGTKACPTPHNCMRRGACIDKWDDLGPAASTDAARANAGY